MACRSVRSRSASALIAAQDVARGADLDLLHKELGFAAGAFDQQRRQGLLVLEDQAANDRAAALAGAENDSSRRSSSAAIVAAEIMPRSATTQTRPLLRDFCSGAYTAISQAKYAVKIAKM
jgi:hypothetical protein